MKTQHTEVKSSNISIDSISAGELLSTESGAPDTETQAALDDLNHEHLKSLQQDRKMREAYADKIFNLVKAWLIAVGVFLAISGFGNAFNFFTIEASVLTTLVGGTTLGVVGLFATVAKYLFNEKQIK